MKDKKIVLTGGPCAGKTTAIQQIEKEFTEKGYQVLIVPEAATLLINSGTKPFGNFALDTVEFQKQVITLQLTLEQLAEETAKKSKYPTIIVCDRGILDDKAYVTKTEWKKLLQGFSLKEFDLMNRYDLVIHLKTAALGKEEFYTLENNSARTETIEEARKKDEQTLKSWLGHEKLKIIGNEKNFENKIKQVIKEIYIILLKPYPLQIQRKYVVDKIDLEKIQEENIVKLDLEQYIVESGNVEYIYRKTSKEQEKKYTLITKIDTEINNERITTERKITEKEYYLNLPDQKPLQKTRYCFEYQNEYFRLDIFQNNLQLLEVEITTPRENVSIPEFITIKEEVTNNIEYRNATLYKKNNSTTKDIEKILKK